MTFVGSFCLRTPSVWGAALAGGPRLFACFTPFSSVSLWGQAGHLYLCQVLVKLLPR